MYSDVRLVYDLTTGFGATTFALPIKLLSDLSKDKLMLVDTIKNNLNRLEDYIWRWYPVLLQCNTQTCISPVSI